MSKEGIEFIDRNFHSGGAVDVDGEIFNFFRSVLCLSTSESLWMACVLKQIRYFNLDFIEKTNSTFIAKSYRTRNEFSENS